MSCTKKILIVDDEQTLLRILKIKLLICGYEVLTAFNGREALKILDSESPDLMLLDIIMPGMDGFGVLKHLGTGCGMPVIVFSAKPENSSRALKMGACDFVTKPFDMDDLIRRIQKAILNGGQKETVHG